MNAWINIEVSLDDKEIAEIDRLEEALGNIPDQIRQIRELITRFETCHFKYQQHYRHIMESIAILQPVVDVSRIGSNHPRHSGNAWKNDTTGRSRIGHHYILALGSWLEEASTDSFDEDGTVEFKQRVKSWLGERNRSKDMLVRMLIARLLYRSVEEYRRGGEWIILEYQIESTDICNYAFPANLEKLLQCIGKLQPVEVHDGCGTSNAEIKSFIIKVFSKLCEWLMSDIPDLGFGKNEPVRIWLVACFAKTMKEQIHLTDPLPELMQ